MALPTQDELINQATEIITQDYHDDTDTKKLARIRYLLAINYKTLNTRGSAIEWQYNQHRAKKTVELQETIAVWKAENLAKLEAEDKYWDYRKINAEAGGINKMLDAIEWFIITVQVELKAQNKVGFNNNQNQ